MRVRNILISNLEVFEECLIRELIKNEISYVQIDHEFHFQDKIYRFYNADKYISLDKLVRENPTIIPDEYIFVKPYIMRKKEIPSKSSYPPEHISPKSMIKRQNKMWNQKIKRT